MVVLITGASAGFGAACAREFVARGAKVIITARREERLLALQRELGESSCAIIAQDIAALNVHKISQNTPESKGVQ